MNNLSRKDYNGSINIEQINKISQIDSNTGKGAKKIQEVKENIISKIYSIGKIDSRGIKELEELYINNIEDIEGIEFEQKQEYINDSRKNIELMFKKQTKDSLGDKKGYIGDFDKFIPIINKYIGTTRKDLYALLSDEYIPEKEKFKIKKYLSILKSKSIENTRKRELNFDLKAFKSYIGDEDHKNIECFYEEDFNGNKNYFSINTLLSYIETFGSEIGIFELNSNIIPKDIKNKYFPSLNKKIKTSMYKTIIEELRDKQEVIMYGFKDYEILNGIDNNKKNGFIAEKIIELEFRELANISNYDISIIKGSIGEDQQHKIDLYITIKDKKTGVSIKDELQITLKENLELKQKQVQKRNKFLDKKGDYSEMKLINLALKDLGEKKHIWKYFNRPIGKLSDTLDNVEKTTIRETFKRLVKSLETKKIMTNTKVGVKNT